jgi:predicted nucleic acid-binding protein
VTAHCLDSSAWIEIFHGGANAKTFLKPVTGSRPVVVSAISLYEVWNYAATHAGEPRADQIADALRAYTVAAVDDSIALHSARLSREHRLPLADALIYATALAHEATLWTQDRDFEGLPNVRYLPKEPR